MSAVMVDGAVVYGQMELQASEDVDAGEVVSVGDDGRVRRAGGRRPVGVAMGSVRAGELVAVNVTNGPVSRPTAVQEMKRAIDDLS